MTQDGLSQIVSVIAEEYGAQARFTADRLRIWAEALKDVSDEQGRGAVIRLIQTSPYPPKASDIRRMVFGDPGDIERRLDEEAELAIAHLEQHVCDYRMVDLGPVLNATVRAMNGLDAVIAMMDTDGWKFERARARILYRAFRRRGVRGEEGSVLMPLAITEHLAHVPLSVYQERGIPLPIIRAPFGEKPMPALETGEPA